ncbi:MAG TPA: hypothetical protein VMQ52_03240 [Candidatus Saccharimonadales bacterium]|nr:hypothetical protein [Candidatus Saccharimonadales bacterium]
MAYNDLVYCASPARLGNLKHKIMEYVADQNKGPLHPFNALPYKYFEGGKLGRAKTMEVCCSLIGVCDEFWIFGISEGTLIEATYFFAQASNKNKPFRVLVNEFDKEWKIYAKKYSNNYKETLKKLGL